MPRPAGPGLAAKAFAAAPKAFGATGGLLIRPRPDEKFRLAPCLIRHGGCSLDICRGVTALQMGCR